VASDTSEWGRGLISSQAGGVITASLVGRQTGRGATMGKKKKDKKKGKKKKK
jgi:hypothetical protein